VVVGTGLGLAICRSLSRLMGGDTLFTSIEGEGSTFHAYVNVGPVQRTVCVLYCIVPSFAF
jgi:signal transduction histidine kinase